MPPPESATLCAGFLETESSQKFAAVCASCKSVEKDVICEFTFCAKRKFCFDLEAVTRLFIAETSSDFLPSPAIAHQANTHQQKRGRRRLRNRHQNGEFIHRTRTARVNADA